MATKSDRARDELVKIVGAHVKVLRLMAELQKADLCKSALREIVDAYERLDEAWRQEQIRQTSA